MVIVASRMDMNRLKSKRATSFFSKETERTRKIVAHGSCFVLNPTMYVLIFLMLD